MPVPGSPKEVHVTVTINSDAPGDFRIAPEPLGALPIGPNGDLIFENDGHSGFFIYFDLKDPNKLGYSFPTDHKLINETVWSELGAGACPTTGKWDVFTPRKVLNGGATLKVRNENLTELGIFGYVLRVTKDGGKTYHPLDPGGDNRNGPIATTKSYSAASLAIGIVLGVVATLGTQVLLQG